MVQFPNCPRCTNTGLSVIDISIDGQMLKGVQCNHCNEIIWVYQDNSDRLAELKDMIENLESSVDELESELSRIRCIEMK